ncbi:hypothetical protein V6N13_132692 [Hibiscus sabdariffa]|uniref:Uncharacterized protein n=1 Tax=Hibiscus sabdariffa TaxID=183260 RepID=A0ABR2PW26_9ROSI
MNRKRVKTGNPNKVLWIFKEAVEYTRVHDKDLNLPYFLFPSHLRFLLPETQALDTLLAHVAFHQPPPYGQRGLRPRVRRPDGGLGGLWGFRPGNGHRRDCLYTATWCFVCRPQLR